MRWNNALFILNFIGAMVGLFLLKKGDYTGLLAIINIWAMQSLLNQERANELRNTDTPDAGS